VDRDVAVILPRLVDKNRIRALLLRDRFWCVYALGDLTPRMFEKCQWFTPDLTMVLHDYGTCILFAHGTGSIREAIDHVSWPVHLQVRRDALDEIKHHATVTSEKQMLRMAWHRRAIDVDPRPARLTEADAAALVRLYQDGEWTGESPDFFYPAMLESGTFFGIFEGGEIVAAAGTHLVAPDEGAAAIGNVYTRRDRRGRGYGRAVTSAVIADLQEIATIGLNVKAANLPAIRIYESLGCSGHCEFVEALATARR
jgi:ribosomal protein S18 acetylase RimI-like enzyme